MNFDEQKLKRLDNIRLNDNQYENVIPCQSTGNRWKCKGNPSWNLKDIFTKRGIIDVICKGFDSDFIQEFDDLVMTLL